MLTLGEDGCGEHGEAPALVRTNVGLLHHRGDGTYAYGCPSRWGGAETALAAADGERTWLAGAGGVFVTADGGCTAAALDVAASDTPVVLRAWDGEGWLLARDFDAGRSSLWRLGTEAATTVPLPDGAEPDGFVHEAAGGWLAGGRPSPGLWTFDGEAVTALAPTWPEAVVDRIVPRLAVSGGVWLVATSPEGRALWWSDGEVVTETGIAGQVIHGPAALPGGVLVVVDGQRWWLPDGGVAAPIGAPVAWTCLGNTGAAVIACQLDEALRVTAPEHDGELIFSLQQVDGPDDACDPVGTSCALDWQHFGGESGWVRTLPATCPDGVREERPGEPEPLPDTDGCAGCRTGQPAGAILVLAALTVRSGRRRQARG